MKRKYFFWIMALCMALLVSVLPVYSDLPYPTLGEVFSKQQHVFELRDVQGTLVGFRLPQYLKETNVAGYHFHFITSDRKAGGHLLDGEFLDNVAEIDAVQDWEVTLPKHSSFAKAKLE